VNTSSLSLPDTTGTRPISLPGLIAAGINIGRVILVLGAVLTLGIIRTGIPAYVYAIAVGLSLAAIWSSAASRSDFRLWATYILGFVLFVHLRTLGDETGMAAQFGYVIALEKALCAGVVPTVWLQGHLYALGDTSWLETGCLAIYITYFFAPHLVGLAVWRLDHQRFRLYAVAMLVTFYVGLVACFVLPTAPPWLAAQTGDLPHVYRVITDIGHGTSPETYRRGYEIASGNPVAAMPSLHMAVTCIIALIGWRCHRLSGVGGVLYAASMGFALVYLGEHYVVDILAGIVTALIVWRLVDSGLHPQRVTTPSA
jgi:membrane-associated phospholipid phosphatase